MLASLHSLSFLLVPLFLVSYSITMRRTIVAAWNTAEHVRRPRVLSRLSYDTVRRQSPALSTTNAAQRINHFSTLYHASKQQRKVPLLSSSRLFSVALDYSDEVFDTQATFESIGIESTVLLERLSQLGLEIPTKVQAESFAKIKSATEQRNVDGETRLKPCNVILASQTGSGKTLAYLLPILDDILTQKQQQHEGKTKMLSYDYARAIILVPNKELVQQVLRMAVPLCGGSQSVLWSGGTQVTEASDSQMASKCPPHEQVRLAVLPGGLVEPLDFKPFRDTVTLGGGTEAPVDIIVSTPAALGPLGLKPKHIDMFADIETLVVDEADMLLDGGYIRPLENVLMGFRRADRLDPSMGVPPTQHIFCAATLPDMGLKSVDAYLQRKFPYAERVQMSGMHNARHSGLKQATQWIGPIETKKERMEQLIEMLETPSEEGGLLGEKVMVFLNSVEDVEGAQSALDRAGISSVPYHAKIKLDERSKLLDQFRQFSIQGGNAKNAVPVLVCTDLASRGLDVPGVSAVVQLQFSGNVVSHLHRMGRCGRAGQRTGRGIVFFTETEEELIEVVKEAEDQQERMVLEGDVDDRSDEDEEETGKVNPAFSRKRGFNKKRKKLMREEPQL